MTITRPAGVSAKGTTSVVFVTTIASQAAPDLSSEIQAASSVILSCYLYGDSLSPVPTTNVGNDTRMCDTNQPEAEGYTTWSFPEELVYVIQPQVAAASDAARNALPHGATGFLVFRYGLAAKTAEIAAADYVDVIPVLALWPHKMLGGDGGSEFSKWAHSQKFLITGDPTFNVQVVA